MVLRRWAAFGWDYLLILAYLALLAAIGLAAGPAARRLFADPGRAEAAGFLLLTLPVILYFTLMEGGRGAATWGKRRLGLRVIGLAGRPVGRARALVRSLVKFLPWGLAHASIWRLALPSPTPSAAAQAGVIAALALAVLWALSPWMSAPRRAVYDWIAGTRVAPVDGPGAAPNKPDRG